MQGVQENICSSESLFTEAKDYNSISSRKANTLAFWRFANFGGVRPPSRNANKPIALGQRTVHAPKPRSRKFFFSVATSPRLWFTGEADEPVTPSQLRW